MKRNYSRLCSLLLIVLATGFSAHSLAQTINTIAGTGTGGYTGEGAALAKQLRGPFGVAVDAAGNVFVADKDNHRIRKITTGGVISTVAGTGTILPTGYSGDGVPATSTNINYPFGITVDAAGNLYIADTYNNRIRKVNPAGIISTIAGTGFTGYSGDGAQATDATLSFPTGVTLDATGNLYVAEYGNHIIRKIATTGIISTVAGIGTPGLTGDGGAATAAQIRNPYNVTFDPIGNMFIADAMNSEIRKVTPAGTITTFHLFPFGTVVTWVTADASGNIYASIDATVLKFDPTGAFVLFAGTGTAGFGGDGGPATGAQFNNVGGIAIGPTGKIYLGDQLNHRVREISFPVTPVNPITGPTNVCIAGTITLSNSTLGGTWSSVNPAVATIDISTGIVTGVSPGVIITYTIPTNFTTIDVTVDALPSGGKILGVNNACPGTTVILSNKIPGGTWSTASPTIATVASSGIVTAVAPGTSIIYYTVTTPCGSSAAIKYPFTVLSHAFCVEGVATASQEPTAIKAWPNPNEGTFTINLGAANNEEANVTITNVVGKKIMDFKMTTNSAKDIKLDAPDGVYFLSAVSEHGRWSEKVLVSAWSSR